MRKKAGIITVLLLVYAVAYVYAFYNQASIVYFIYTRYTPQGAIRLVMYHIYY